MWALRRASNPLKSKRTSLGSFYAASAKFEASTDYLDEKCGVFQYSQAVSDKNRSLLRSYHSIHVSSNFFFGKRSLSSDAGAKSKREENDSEDEFSEIEKRASAEANENDAQGEVEDAMISQQELSGDDEDIEETAEIELSESETDSDKKKISGADSELFKVIVSAPALSVHKALDKLAEEGKNFTREEIASVMSQLRRRKMFARALQLSEWLEANKRVDLAERDYASRLDLISKTRGLLKAESYINKIPESFRNELVYRTLLANCVASNNMKKAEEVFNKMKDLNFPLTAFACNQLLLLYKRHDKKKIADVLLLMEKENVKPTLFTYQTLIDTKGLSSDISGMDQIVETMKAEGIEPDLRTQFILAKHYASGGFKEKAQEILEKMEGGNLKENRWTVPYLFHLYADLGKGDEIQRVWKAREPNPHPEECVAAIYAWGRLKKIEEAEAAFNVILRKYKPSSRQYCALLKVYSDNKMLEKGKELVKQMANSGCYIGPLTWDALVKLYVQAGEVMKADSLLYKASQQKRVVPMFNSFMTVMEQYVKRGDIHNSEKIFHRMRQAGYVARARQFQALLQAYINAKQPAYGMRERMKADNIFPSRSMSAQLVQVDAFRKTAVSDLLE